MEKRIMDYAKILLEKGFSLNSYPEGKFWEINIVEDVEKKVEVCNYASAVLDVFVAGEEVETVILQCSEDFTYCIFYFDCNVCQIKTDIFMDILKKL